MSVGRKALKKYFLENVTGPVKVKHVARALGIKDSEYRLLRKLMREMAAEGVLSRVRKNCYTLAEGEDTVPDGFSLQGKDSALLSRTAVAGIFL